MYVLFEEKGELRAGTVITEQAASLQVELPHGKRVKIKAVDVLLRFDNPPAVELMARAQASSQEIDLDFLWQCAPPTEFNFEQLGRDYYGHGPKTVEATALLLKLHAAPMYFYRKGRGRYKAATVEALKAALASAEKKRMQAEQKQNALKDLRASRLPKMFVPVVQKLLYAPDKNSLEWKTIDTACAELGLTPGRLLARCGALRGPHDYHLNRFLFEYFPDGVDFPHTPALEMASDLPCAAVAAFSIDDAATTEIDDAFSVGALPDGGERIGIHIALPALGIGPASPWDAIARKRLSTVYFPGNKITMLPPAAIAAFTLAAGSERPALSLYADVNDAGVLTTVNTRCERVPIVANLRNEELERVFNAETLVNNTVTHEFGATLQRLWKVAMALKTARGKLAEEHRVEYSFQISGDRVRIAARPRGTPLDTIVAELMIYANTEWARQLAAAGYAAIYRAQSAGVARMTVEAAPHEGIGAAHYAWTSSPLRRYVDLINQRQVLALATGQSPPYAANEELSELARTFERTYDAYAELQRQMERYWSLRWLEQEKITHIKGTVIRDNLVRLDDLPLVVRVLGLRNAATGERVGVTLSKIDLWDLTLHAELVSEETGV